MPKFPFRRSVAQDLRDLWTIDRLDRQARSLGQSSITQGEGSFDLLDSNGSPVARIGDTGTGFGVMVPDGSGGWRTVQADAQARSDAAQVAAASYTDTQLAPVASEVQGARGGFGSLDGRLDDHASRLGSTEGDISSVSSEVATARGGFGTLGGRLNDHVSRIGGNETDINTLEGQVSTLNLATNSQGLKINQLVDRVNLLTNRVNALDGGSTPPISPL